MTKDLEGAIKNAYWIELANELMRMWSFAIPGVGASHPYNELKRGESSPALEWLKKNKPDSYKYLHDLVEKDRAEEAHKPNKQKSKK